MSTPNRSNTTVVCATPELGIARSAYYFPPQRYTVEQWGALLNQPAALIKGLRSSGMREYHVATDEGPVELAWQAASRCCAGLDPAQIDALIVVSTLGCSRPPAPLTVHEALRRKLGMRPDSACFTLVDMHCASLMGALQMTHRLLARHPTWQRVLIVSVDKMYEEWARNIAHHAIQSDGSAAVLIERGAALSRCEGVALRVEPQYAKGFLKPPELQRRFIESYHVVAFGVLSSLLTRMGWGFDDIDAYLFPNINPAPYAALIEAAGIDRQRLYGLSTNVPRHGHANCSDFVVNLTDWLRERPSATPQRVLAYASGTTGFFCSLALTVHPDAVNHAAESFAGDLLAPTANA
jgi:3-oxoacyl-[acyl-carrier-protein] synthase III